MKIFKAILLIAVLSLFSCEKFLDEELTGGVTADGVYNSPQGINFALNATYEAFTRLMGNSNNREDGWSLTTLGTDTYVNGSDGGNKAFNRYDADLRASSGILNSAWSDMYRGINTANAVIGRAPDVIQNTDELNNILGQAHFLRGYYYYWLVRQWGDVHYTDVETQGVEIEANRTPVEEVYARIIKDMEFAAENLPGFQGDRGRITSWAAKTALAEIHLTNKNYDEAAQYAEDVINNGPFDLVRPFADLWKLDNEDNEEVIYAVQFTEDPLFDASGNPAHLFFLMEYDRLDGMKRSLEFGRPFKRFKPTNYLLQLYDLEDERYDATFRSVYTANNESSLAAGVNLGDTAVYLPRVPLTQEQKDARPYGDQVFNIDEYTERIFPTNKKWEQPNRADVQDAAGGRDFVVYRYADVLLIASEANALKSSPNQTKALQYYNEVRLRAYDVDDVTSLPAVTSVDLDLILEERAKEFAGEGKRWFDLVRVGKLAERVRLHNDGGAPNIQDFHHLRPIPLNQIDRTANEFPQNPGY
ncbi:MAG: RagB/SusD family nutrient uptake outer membrane protein [Bacteroidota bacterium]